MADLYDVLGVGKNASKAEIRAAYRSKAKSAHPDAGGSKEGFALVKKAHDILTDAGWRQRYDATGEEPEVRPDNDLGNAVQVIASTMDQVLQECAKNGQSPTDIDVVGRIKISVRGVISDFEKQIRITRNILDVDSKLEARFKRRAGKPHNRAADMDVFRAIIAGRISALRQKISNHEQQIKNGRLALEILEDYSFYYDVSGPARSNTLGSIPWVAF